MRKPALIVTVMAAALLIAPASPQDRVNPSRKDEREESTKKVKELQKERIATLEEIVEATGKMFEKRLVKFEEVLEAKLLVLKARLDAAEKESDRITLYKSIVDELKHYEEFADARVKAARQTVLPGLKIKARRLEAEIDLERAKAKEAKKSK